MIIFVGNVNNAGDSGCRNKSNKEGEMNKCWLFCSVQFDNSLIVSGIIVFDIVYYCKVTLAQLSKML